MKRTSILPSVIAGILAGLAMMIFLLGLAVAKGGPAIAIAVLSLLGIASILGGVGLGVLAIRAFGSRTKLPPR